MKTRFPITLATPPYIQDHAIEGKVVYPAVEALITLARAVQSRHPQAIFNVLTGAQFPKMLAIPSAGEPQDAQIEIESSESEIRASLLTSMPIKKSAMSRELEHARVTFVQTMVLPEQPMSFQSALIRGNACISVSAASIYRDLIPFGLSYQNIVGDLAVSAQGALANISGGSGQSDDSFLGSPFVLDAAMHAACVWGQRFADIVSFPVGFDRRIIYAPTKKGGSYIARVKPVDVSREPLIFDVWIYGANGAVHENVTGLRMRDVTRGRVRPPSWIKETAWKK